MIEGEQPAAGIPAVDAPSGMPTRWEGYRSGGAARWGRDWVRMELEFEHGSIAGAGADDDDSPFRVLGQFHAGSDGELAMMFLATYADGQVVRYVGRYVRAERAICGPWCLPAGAAGLFFLWPVSCGDTQT